MVFGVGILSCQSTLQAGQIVQKKFVGLDIKDSLRTGGHGATIDDQERCRRWSIGSYLFGSGDVVTSGDRRSGCKLTIRCICCSKKLLVLAVAMAKGDV